MKKEIRVEMDFGRGWSFETLSIIRILNSLQKSKLRLKEKN